MFNSKQEQELGQRQFVIRKNLYLHCYCYPTLVTLRPGVTEDSVGQVQRKKLQKNRHKISTFEYVSSFVFSYL